MKPGTPAEFDRLSAAYDDLLRDPVRDRFASRDALFFHARKRDLVLDHLRSRRLDPGRMDYLDIGCGRGELLGLFRNVFASSAGCDVSAAMMESIAGITTRVQPAPSRIPFEDNRFDLATAVCVYHHVDPRERVELTRDVCRVLRPGGMFCVIEHNPFNPVTRSIVSRTPVDANAVLLRAAETRALMRAAGLAPGRPVFFLFLPSGMYRKIGRVERMLAGVPLGGQYAVFGRRAG